LQKLLRTAAARHLTLLVAAMGGRLAASAALMAVAGVLEAAGVIALVLLVGTLGVDVTTGGTASLADASRRFLASTGVAPSLLPVLAAYVALTVIQALVLRAQTVINLDIEYRFVALLRSRLYDAVAHARWAFVAQSRGTDFSHALTTELDRAGLATYQLLWSASTIFVMAAQVVLALQVSTPLTVLVFGAGAVLILLLAPQLRAARAAGEAITTATSEAHALVIEHLAGMKTVKSQAAERASAKEFSRLASAVAHHALDAARLQANLRAMFETGAVVILAVLLMVAVKMLAVPAASLFVLLFLFARLMPRVSSVQQGLHQYVTALPALVHVERLQARAEAARETNAIASEEPVETAALRRAVRLERATFAYVEDARPAVDGVTLSIPVRQTTAFVGPSGCGKTTLADLVTGLLSPTAGRVLIDDLELSAERAPRWRARIGYVAQDTFFFHDTVRANLKWAVPDASDADLESAIRAAVADFIYGLPDGLDTVIGDRGTRLSGGERQRIALARALLRRPDLLILDEATSALDPASERKVHDAIDGLRGSMTILLITHRLWTLGRVDTIHVIEEGRLVESGPWDTLRAAASSRFSTLCRAGEVAAVAARGGYPAPRDESREALFGCTDTMS
jgi:ATP-binding cassette subfamily C protein